MFVADNHLGCFLVTTVVIFLYNGKKLLDSYKAEIPDDIGCQVDLTPKYNGFIENPIDYSEAEVAAMTSLAGVDETSAISAGQYSISSAEELAKLARMTNSGLITGGEFVLASDIDLSALELVGLMRILELW